MDNCMDMLLTSLFHLLGLRVIHPLPPPHPKYQLIMDRHSVAVLSWQSSIELVDFQNKQSVSTGHTVWGSYQSWISTVFCSKLMFTFQFMASASYLLQRWHPAYQPSASGIPLKMARHPAYQRGRVEVHLHTYIVGIWLKKLVISLYIDL